MKANFVCLVFLLRFGFSFLLSNYRLVVCSYVIFLRRYKFDGTTCLCTVHYVDVIIDGLPDKKNFSFFTQQRFLPNPVPLGFDGLPGRVAWNWQNLERVKDVVMSYDTDADKVKKIRGKLGTRIITCKQAADLANMINFDDDEYLPDYMDYVKVLRKDPKNPKVRK